MWYVYMHAGLFSLKKEGDSLSPEPPGKPRKETLTHATTWMNPGHDVK